MIDEKRAKDIFTTKVVGFSIIKQILFKGNYYFLAKSDESDEFPSWFCLYSKTGQLSDINPWSDISDISEFEKLAIRA